MGILAASSLTLPLRLGEKLLFDRQIARTKVHEQPIFIQGFARSGTTHLHNLMAQDPGLGFVTTYQAVAAPFFLITRGWLDRLIARRLPTTRPMDNVAVSLDFPQEEELALAAKCCLSSVHHLSFPERAREIMTKMGRMELNEAEMQEWNRNYMYALRAATLTSYGRPLVLKTPANLGRTRLLLKLFPDAKFVFVVRNPYVVFSSTMRLYRTMIPLYQLQEVDWDVIESAVFSNYVDMTHLYMQDRELIPKGNLMEVKFEDIEEDALDVLENIYNRLGLQGWTRAQKPITEYLDTLSGYRKNRYSFDQDLLNKVDREWGFAVREWGYLPPSERD